MPVNRRTLVGAIAAAAGSLPFRALANAVDLRSAARDAWIFCVPLIETARVRAHTSDFAPGQSRGSAINNFVNFRRLATPAERLVTSPNVDTLYSMAFLDLANGPATIGVPVTGDRYFSLELMDMYTNSFAVIGTRVTGGAGGTFVIVRPQGSARSGAIEASTSWVWALARTGVNGSESLAVPHSIQDRLLLKTNPARALPKFADRTASWRDYFSSASLLLKESPPHPADASIRPSLRALGVDPSQTFDPTIFIGPQVDEIKQGVADAQAILDSGGPVQSVDGWRYSHVNVAEFQTNYLERARVAVGGLGALPRPEAIYMRAIAPDGSVRFDNSARRLTFPPGQLPPVDAFWALTMYEVAPFGQSFLTPNAINRYAIGNLTEGLRHNSDGSLDIWIARKDPGGVKTANWLPAPALGPYVLSMRTYLPKPSLLTGAYRLPAVVAG